MESETRNITKDENDYLDEYAEKIADVNLFHILVNQDLKKLGIISIDTERDYQAYKSICAKHEYLLN